MNFVFIAVFIGGVFAWQNTNKEEMPDITFDRIRVSARYPGAPAQDVEYFVTKPLEDALRGIDGVYSVSSTSSVGSSSVSIELEPNYSDKDDAITEIRNTVLDVKLPDDVTDDPSVRVFKTTKKAIIDIALIDKNVHLLNTDSRRNLQKYALALENQLLNLSQINSINKSGYLSEEIQIKVYPTKLLKYEIPFNNVMREIKNNHVRQPAGTIENAKEPKVTILSELNTTKKLNDLVIQGGFEGNLVRLNEVADVIEGYEKNKDIIKINGHEGIMFSVVKNSSAGILEALDSVRKVTKDFRKNNVEGSSIEVLLLDDESIDVRNRLSIISINGAIGFILILISLFVFLNKRSGVWVAMGIPFTFCFTMLAASMMGYTINNTTLAAVIIVMGMIVDDAIVVAENISRCMSEGMERGKAIVTGTTYVLLPIVASIATTCVAFIPLFFFSGHFGSFVAHIPPIIFLMLIGSLIESIFILPGHMGIDIPFISKKANKNEQILTKRHWFEKVEDNYGEFLQKILKFKWIMFAGFIFLMLFSGFIAKNKMKFVMFPREETRSISLTGAAPAGTTRFQTAELTKQIEEYLETFLGKEIIGFRTQIARSRRGGAVEENKFRIRIEIVPKEERAISADQLIKKWEEKFKDIKGFDKLKFQKSHWGRGSGSPIEVVVLENNDEIRAKVVKKLFDIMEQHKDLANVEIERSMTVPEYKIVINRDKIKRLSISPADISSTFRSALEGTVLFDFSNGDEDVDVKFTIVDKAKDDIEKVLDLPVENKGDYLVPLRDIVTVEEVTSPNSIARQKSKRTTLIDAAIKVDSKVTSIDIAEYLEKNVFPEILSEFPSSVINFDGEIKDTRESKSDFSNAVIMALFLIYFILAVLFNSLLKPFIIMLAIPFGVVGIILAFWLHGKLLFGFFAAVGALGLAGVVVNDSIIMLVKLDKQYKNTEGKDRSNYQISQIAKTRLRAILLTTITTVAGVLPTAYGFAGYDSMLAEMMLALTWGLMFATVITLILIPCVYSMGKDLRFLTKK